MTETDTLKKITYRSLLREWRLSGLNKHLRASYARVSRFPDPVDFALLNLANLTRGMWEEYGGRQKAVIGLLFGWGGFAIALVASGTLRLERGPSQIAFGCLLAALTCATIVLVWKLGKDLESWSHGQGLLESKNNFMTLYVSCSKILQEPIPLLASKSWEWMQARAADKLMEIALALKVAEAKAKKHSEDGTYLERKEAEDAARDLYNEAHHVLYALNLLRVDHGGYLAGIPDEDVEAAIRAESRPAGAVKS